MLKLLSSHARRLRLITRHRMTHSSMRSAVSPGHAGSSSRVTHPSRTWIENVRPFVISRRSSAPWLES
eukprot:15064816-Alexandrium_andersonii.AAC.1